MVGAVRAKQKNVLIADARIAATERSGGSTQARIRVCVTSDVARPERPTVLVCGGHASPRRACEGANATYSIYSNFRTRPVAMRGAAHFVLLFVDHLFFDVLFF